MSEAYAKANTVMLAIISVVAATAALIYTRPVIVPFVIAVFLYFVISPAVTLVQGRLRIPRGPSLAVVAAVFLIVSGVLIFLVASSVEGFVHEAGAYRDRVLEFINWGSGVLVDLGVAVDSAAIRTELKRLPVLDMTRGLTGGVLTLVSSTALVVIFVLFMLAGKSDGSHANALTAEISAQVSRYVAAKLLLSVATGVLVGVVLVSLGVELAFMFAVLTVLLNFIPNIGSVVATALPVPVLLLQFGLGWQLPVGLGLLGAIQFSIGNVLEPKMMGESLDLHPVSILVFLMFWGLVWGLPGMFLAVPITAVLKITLSRLESTRPLADLLAGKLPGGE
jgi:AI-2 transport protein TqsA